MDWEGMFAVQMPVAEIVLRASTMYWFLFLVFRFVLRRDVGAVGIADILLLVLVADGAQNAMAGGYKSITEGLILVSTILGWNGLLDWLTTKSRTIARFVVPRPLALVRNGRILRANLRQEMMTVDDLHSRLRLQGIEKVAEVKIARLEEDGQVSVIKFRSGPTEQGDKNASRPL
jgi:uncharacterized membrane protein YcaP (DUF421 family)